jgi:twinkle protein
MTVGKRRVVSVPNGAPKQSSDDQELTEGPLCLVLAAPGSLDRVKQVIIAVDGDEAGKALAADLCRLFGPERCMFVEWSADCKDANDVLQTTARGAGRGSGRGQALSGQGPLSIDDFPEQPQYTAIPSGIDQLDRLFQVVPRTFTVVTGYAGQGKTSFLMWLSRADPPRRPRDDRQLRNRHQADLRAQAARRDARKAEYTSTIPRKSGNGPTT